MVARQCVSFFVFTPSVHLSLLQRFCLHNKNFNLESIANKCADYLNFCVLCALNFFSDRLLRSVEESDVSTPVYSR